MRAASPELEAPECGLAGRSTYLVAECLGRCVAEPSAPPPRVGLGHDARAAFGALG